MASLEEKRERRLQFMNRLYELTDGDEMQVVNMFGLGQEFGWAREETTATVRYLKGERLLEIGGLGAVVSITHLGVVEVEDALSNPREGTEHFPPAVNVIHIGQMHGSQIQQGTVRSEQHGTFGDQPDFDQLRSVAKKLRAILPTLDLGDDDRQEAEAELSTAEIQLGSNRPKLEIIRASLGRLAGLLGTASSAVTNSVELTQALETLHKELPGI